MSGSIPRTGPAVLAVAFAIAGLGRLSAADAPAAGQSRELLEWAPLPPLPAGPGVAGPFTGVHQDTLLVAGGANFPEPVWESDKVWHDTVYALPLTGEDRAWEAVGRLPRPLGYGACVSVPEGVVCLGGNDAGGVYADAFLLRLAGDGGLAIDPLPPLPGPLCHAAAARLGDHIYVAGGQSGTGLESASKAFWRLDWSKHASPDQPRWEAVDPWPGPARALHVAVAQHDGHGDRLYLFGGRHVAPSGEVEFLTDHYAFDPGAVGLPGGGAWSPRAGPPRPQAAGTAAAFGQGHIITLGGADGSLFARTDELRDDHPGFPRDAFAYHTVTDRWVVAAGQLPANQVTTHAVPWGDRVLLASGEVRPRVRTTAVWSIAAARPDATGFGWINWTTVAAYLAAVLGIGIYFARRNRDTDDFFRGGQRVPGTVAGLSIFATLLSSISFLAIPARAFATDWTFVVLNAGILLCAPLVAWKIVPFFRNLDITSAYEFLERRFNLGVRLFASASFVLFQVGRMAVVMYLPALALSAITPLDTTACILAMGLLSIAYCTLGGLEAVVWTDALQAVILLGGAALSFALVIGSLDGGWAEFAAAAAAADKLRWADFGWGPASYAAGVFWVVLLGGIGNSLIPYTSDQAVVQRYVATPTTRGAARAAWLNAGLAAVATPLFLGLGTALFAFYRARPENLEPALGNDAVFPLFISRELPAGAAGLVIAAVFAAAQSTVSTSMNSTATAVATDFFQRLGWRGSERAYLRLARLLTAALGTAGTGAAVLLAASDIESAWQTFITIIGFVMGPLCGLFLLGIFSRRANAAGAVAGAAAGVAALAWTRYATPAHGLLYAPLGIAVTAAVGYCASFNFPGRTQTPR